MRSRFALIFAGIAAIAAGTWYAIRTSATPAPRTQPDRAAPVSPDRAADRPGTEPGTASPTRNVPPPRLGTTAASGTAQPAERVAGATSDDVHDAFAIEPRDDGWAGGTELELRERAARAVAVAGARLEGVECRAQRCQITVQGDGSDVIGAVIANLEEASGLDGLADAMILTAPEPLPGGALRLRVYAIFERAP